MIEPTSNSALRHWGIQPMRGEGDHFGPNSDPLADLGDCPVGAYADHRARCRNETGPQITPHTLALGGWRSILLRSLSGCLLLCLIRLRRPGQDSRRESLRIL